jgi:hypothetical protein
MFEATIARSPLGVTREMTRNFIEVNQRFPDFQVMTSG